MGAEVVVGDLMHAADVADALEGCRRMYFGMSVSPTYLEATVIAAAAVTTNKGANRQFMLPQTFHNGATDCAHVPSCTGYEDRVLIRHSSSPLLFSLWTRSKP